MFPQKNGYLHRSHTNFNSDPRVAARLLMFRLIMSGSSGPKTPVYRASRWSPSRHYLSETQ